jgi:serine incorporator 1/3
MCLPSSTKSSKYAYIIILVLSTLLSLILRYYGKPLVVELPLYGRQGICTSEACYGVGAVFRISFASFVFFLGHALLVKCIGKAADSGWILKLLGWVGLLVVGFLLPNDFYDGYTWISRLIAAVFLVLQCATLLEAIYKFRDMMMQREAMKAILVITVVAYLAAGIALVLLFVYFGTADCNKGKAFITIALVTSLLYSALSVSSFARHGILPSSLVSLYSYWVIYSALSSNPDTSCNPTASNSTASIILSIIWATISVSYAGFSTASGVAEEPLQGSESVAASDKRELLTSGSFLSPEEIAAKKAEAAARRVEDAEVADIARENGGGENSEDVFKSRNWRFHLVLASCTMFMAMTLSNWQTASQSNNQDGVFDMGSESMWIKVVTQWVVAALYVWTIVAPVVCSGRDFD